MSGPSRAKKLYEEALAGVCQAARKPMPRGLRAELAKALAPDADPAVLEALLARFRQKMGPGAGADAFLVAARSVAGLLDRHSGLVTAEEQRRAIGLDQESIGLGLELREAVVEAVLPGSPAQRAGLRPGDVILGVNGNAMAELPPELAIALKTERVPHLPTALEPVAAAKEIGPLRLRFRRPGEDRPRRATLARMRFRPEAVQGVRRRDSNEWDFFVDGSSRMAFVRLGSLSRGSGNELRAVAEALAYREARGLVLDLRWCPGGYLNEAVDVADLFLGGAVLATVKARNREDMVYRGHGTADAASLPLVVLVNAETSGGAELVAAALQDHKRALVVGQRTLGKASVQTPLPVGLDGVGFKITSGTFFRPSGKNLHRFPESRPCDDWGVVPDKDCRVSAALSARLKGDWLRWSLRPAASLERLALDDPLADGQRSAALAVLRAEIERGARRAEQVKNAGR